MIEPVESSSRDAGGAGSAVGDARPAISGDFEYGSGRGRIFDGRAATPRKGKPGKLCSTFYLALPPDEALEALKKLGMARFSLEFVTIPATGGCVVAVFSKQEQRLPLFNFRRTRELQTALGLLLSLGATAITHRASGSPVASSAG